MNSVSPWETGPTLVGPYCGQNQTSQIEVIAPIAYKYIDREEGPWAMLPYASLYPPAAPAPTLAALPPPLTGTDLWKAMQEWPLPQAG